MSMGSRPARQLVLAFLALMALGCGTAQERGEVRGVALLNGKPLADALVTFLPDPDQAPRVHQGSRAAGKTDVEGRFEVQGEDRKPGAAVGEYRVVVEDLAIYSAPREPDGTFLRKPVARIPPKFGDALRTPLRQSVRKGVQDIQIDLSERP